MRPIYISSRGRAGRSFIQLHSTAFYVGPPHDFEAILAPTPASITMLNGNTNGIYPIYGPGNYEVASRGIFYFLMSKTLVPK
jgi:hypothetical protein